MFKLKNKEFTFDVDVSELPCGLNGALYFVEMEKDGGLSYSGTFAIDYAKTYDHFIVPLLFSFFMSVFSTQVYNINLLNQLLTC